MSIPAGWYDAGTPGRLRWWDGAQWTEHECDAPRPAPQASAQAEPLSPQPEQAAAAGPGIAMGWYPVPGTSQIRWWDGRFWTAYSVGGRGPRGDWYAMEPPGVGYAFGALFLGLGSAQLALSAISGSARFSGIATLVLGLFWLSAAVALSIVRGRPAPSTAPAQPELVQPLPGQVEGAGAGWVPLTPKISRWWSGARWGQYVLEADRVRPTFGGERAYRAMKILAFVVIGLGVLALIAGILMLALEPFEAAHWLGLATTVAGAVLAFVGLIILPLLTVRRPALLLPAHPPTHSL